MPELETRECEACGIQYQPTKSTQKYCPDCIAHGGIRMKRKYDRYTEQSKQHDQLYTPKILTNTCCICNKTFQSIYETNTCSAECRKIQRKRRLVCTQCGASLEEAYKKQHKEITDKELYKHNHFCSAACEHAYFVKRYPAKTCLNCHKTFHSDNIKFCCQTCQQEWNKTHKKQNTQNTTQPKTPARTYTCLVCHQTCEKPAYLRRNFTKPKSSQNLPICSDRCLQIYNKKEQEYKATEYQKRLSDYIQTNGMCSICTVPYTDCERMQSNFRIIPKGARYIDGKIQECPKFQTKFK